MMFRRLMMLAALLACLAGPALAGGKNAELPAQQGVYSPLYRPSGVYTVPVGQRFELLMYQDEGVLPLQASPSGGALPPGASLAEETVFGETARQVLLRGAVLTEGEYSFGVLIQEPAEGTDRLTTLAILQVTLRVSADVEPVEEYLGDGSGMLRLQMNGVNFRRTPGGERLDAYDRGTRFVWCGTQEKGGYTWYRVWSPDHGYGYIRGDMVQTEPPRRIVYTPGKETAFTLFITPGETAELTPSLIMTEAPEEIGFDTEPLVTVVRGEDTWTLLCFCIEEEKTFWIQVDLRDEYGAPLECQLLYLTPRWEPVPAYENH